MATNTQLDLNDLDHITTAMTETAIMDRSEAHTLKAFQEDLPDSHSDLFHHKDLVFTKFPKLPPELRLRIWRDTFPEEIRKFKIDPRVAGGRPGRLLKASNPITLRINDESRAETLRYYKVLLEHANGFKNYYNPGIDCIVIYHWWPFWDKIFTDDRFIGWEWKGGDTARFMEIAEFEYDQNAWEIQFAWGNPWYEPESALEGLRRNFQRLEKLEIYVDKRYPKKRFENLSFLRQCYESLDREFLRGKKELEDDGSRIPEITILGHPRK
jgi:hypothetical protein